MDIISAIRDIKDIATSGLPGALFAISADLRANIPGRRPETRINDRRARAFYKNPDARKTGLPDAPGGRSFDYSGPKRHLLAGFKNKGHKTLVSVITDTLNREGRRPCPISAI